MANGTDVPARGVRSSAGLGRASGCGNYDYAVGLVLVVAGNLDGTALRYDGRLCWNVVDCGYHPLTISGRTINLQVTVLGLQDLESRNKRGDGHT